MAKREDVYDTEINPLMAQIIAICQAHDIPMVASFQINDDRTPHEDEGDGPLLCTTVLPGAEHMCSTLRRAAAALKPRQTQWAVYVEHGDGSRECVAGSHVPGGGE